MAKFASILLLVVVIITVQGAPNPQISISRTFPYRDSADNTYGGRVFNNNGGGFTQHFADDNPFLDPFAGPDDGFSQNHFSNFGNSRQEVPVFSRQNGFLIPQRNPNFGMITFASGSLERNFEDQGVLIIPKSKINPSSVINPGGPNNVKHYSYTKKSESSSSVVNGQKSSSRKTETVIDDNGEVSHHKTQL